MASDRCCHASMQGVMQHIALQVHQELAGMPSVQIQDKSSVWAMPEARKDIQVSAASQQ